MRRVIFVLVACAVVIFVAWALAALPGRVTAEFGDTAVQAPTSVIALGLLLLFVVLYVLIRVLSSLAGLPAAISGWQSLRRRHLGDQTITRTLLALAAGEKAEARREASRARRLMGDTPQTLLLAAEAGRLAGREDEAEALFRKLTQRRDAAFLGFRGLLRQAVAREDWPAATALARQAEAVQPGAAWLRHERLGLAIRAGSWSEALDLAETDAPRAALAVGAAQAELDSARALKLARQAWKEDPSLVPAALTYAGLLRADGRESRAQDVARRTWMAAPHPDLAAFALAPLTEPLTRVQAAQRLTQADPAHVESRLLLARSSLDAGLTGEARRHAEAARDAGLNQRRLWLLLADIEEAEHGDTAAGRAAQREALRRAAAAEPDPSWRCTVCHTSQAAWRPACPACNAPGSLRWGLGPSASYPVAVISDDTDRRGE
ncbi:MAG: hypothetical protein JOY91_09770 [Sinobacteraceae bacterium]|nr:hypothetical protein [Nevskiaceae bacterium]